MKTSLGTLEATSKVDDNPLVASTDKSRPKRIEYAIRDGYKVASISVSKAGNVWVKAASKIYNTTPAATQKALNMSLGTIEAAFKIDNAPLVETADESTPKRNDDTVRIVHKVAAFSGSKEGDVSAKAASKINNTTPIVAQKALDVSFGTAEAASKIDNTSLAATADESIPKRNDDAVLDAHKVAAFSGSKKGDVSMKAASQVSNTVLYLMIKGLIKALDVGLGTLEAASKIDITPLAATTDERRQKCKDDAVPDVRKVAAISDLREGDFSVKAASKINNAVPVATVDENQRVR